MHLYTSFYIYMHLYTSIYIYIQYIKYCIYIIYTVYICVYLCIYIYICIYVHICTIHTIYYMYIHFLYYEICGQSRCLNLNLSCRSAPPSGVSWRIPHCWLDARHAVTDRLHHCMDQPG